MKAKDVFGGREQLPAFLYNGHEVTLTIERSAISMDFLRSLTLLENLKDKEVYESVFEGLSKVIVKWDIDDLKPTAEVLRTLPPDFITAVAEALGSVISGNVQKPGASASS